MDLNVPSNREQQAAHQAASKKKPTFPIQNRLRAHLRSYGRDIELPMSYQRLCGFQESITLYNKEGEDTLWETVIYSPEEWRSLSRGLTQVYAILKAAGDMAVMDHLFADRVDYCTFGNTHPFRIRIVNSLNNNADYYYVKKADASRVYGLELEHLLSPKRIFYLTHLNTLIEEHIVGIPGDIFMNQWLDSPTINPVRIAKELVKFNERCFVRLLGDMRAYNFVVDITPDFEGTQVQIRAMDFDQQSYCGRKNFYLPQFFKDNNPLVEYCLKHLNRTTAYQYQREEQALILKRTQLGRVRLDDLLDCMSDDNIAPEEKVHSLRNELAEHYQEKAFQQCKTMGALVNQSLEQISRKIGNTSLGLAP